MNIKLLASALLAFSVCANAQIFGGGVPAQKVVNSACGAGQVPTYDANKRLTGCASSSSGGAVQASVNFTLDGGSGAGQSTCFASGGCIAGGGTYNNGSATYADRKMQWFANGQDKGAEAVMQLPSGWDGSIVLKLYWVADTATAGNVRWVAAGYCVDAGDPLAYTGSPTEASVATTVNATALNFNVSQLTLGATNLSNCAAGKLLYIKYRRDGDNAADTMADYANLVHLSASYSVSGS